jgi:putative Mn2+ efflux pump MntP
MEILTILFIAVGLSMDSLAVSFAYGICVKNITPARALTISFTFGLFHVIMPLAGYLVGNTFHDDLQVWDHWIAFILLAFLGIKMIYEGITQSEKPPCFETGKARTILSLALGTSLDAFAVGISFGLLELNIIISCLIIGVTAASISLAGIFIGKRMNYKSLKTEIVGGIIILSIGIKILTEHIIKGI